MTDRPTPVDWAQDLETVRKARAGDQAELAQLLERLERVPAIVRSLHGRLGGRLAPDELDDVAQEAVLQIWRKLDTYAGRSRLDSWIFGFVRNEVLRALARRRSRLTVAAATGPDDAAAGGEAADPPAGPDEDAELLWKALGGLDDDSRRLLRLRFEEGWSFRRIGEASDLPLGTIRNRIYRSIEQLRERLRAGRAE